MKLVANTWVLALVEALAEAFALAERLGLDPQGLPRRDRAAARSTRPTRSSRAAR